MTKYVFVWGNNPKRATLKNRQCRKLAVGKMRSCLVEFSDNRQREIVSVRALRRVGNKAEGPQR